MAERYRTVAELRIAYDTGRLSRDDAVLCLDNDDTHVHDETGRVFSMPPDELLAQALDLLGIPHEPA